MSTLKNIIDEVILEAKQDTLKIFYSVDVFIQEFEKEPEEETPAVAVEPEVPATETPPTEEVPATESVITEAIIKKKIDGELSVPKEDALNIQTIQDLIDYLSDKNHTNSTIVEKVLDKKPSGKQEKILTPEIQEVVLILTGVGGEKELGDIIDKGDKVIIDIDYGLEKANSIGFKVNKNAGTDVFSIMMKKDGKILSGTFSQEIINKQILFFRNYLD